MNDEKNNQVEDFLSHYGVLGMKWGKRRSRAELAKARQSTDSKKVSSLTKRKPTELTNKQLQEINKRLNMEQQYSRLTAKQKSKGRKFVEDVLGSASKEAIKNYTSKQMAKALENTLEKKAK